MVVVKERVCLSTDGNLERSGMEAKYLLIETSVAVGQVGLALGSRMLVEKQLDIQHRHNRDLAPAVADLLHGAGWRPRDLHGVIVSRGPGSYTGLRVGVMSAKTLAFATGCRLITVDTFRCLTRQAPAETSMLDVIADAQQGQVYSQAFVKDLPTGIWREATGLTIEPLAAWLERRQPTTWATGPAVVKFARQLSGQTNLVTPTHCVPRLESLLQEGIAHGTALSGAELLACEPLYLRPSSAEEKWAKLGRLPLDAP